MRCVEWVLSGDDFEESSYILEFQILLLEMMAMFSGPEPKPDQSMPSSQIPKTRRRRHRRSARKAPK
jgi:hypothetical protein